MQRVTSYHKRPVQVQVLAPRPDFKLRGSVTDSTEKYSSNFSQLF